MRLPLFSNAAVVAAPGLIVFALLAGGTAFADPAGDLKNGMIAFHKLSSYHMTVTSRGKTIEGDFVAPDRMHVTVAGREVIRIGSTTYFNANGSWMKISAPGASAMMFGPVDDVRNVGAHPNDMIVTDLGPKTAGGISYHAYSVRSSSSPSASICYLDRDGMLARVESTGADGSISTVLFSRFNAPVKIDAPV